MAASSSSSSNSSNIVLVTFVIAHLVFTGSCSAQLSPGFYRKSCPNVCGAVKSVVKSAISKENRIGASLLRLHFHDCFVNVSFVYLFMENVFITSLQFKTYVLFFSWHAVMKLKIFFSGENPGKTRDNFLFNNVPFLFVGVSVFITKNLNKKHFYL